MRGWMDEGMNGWMDEVIKGWRDEGMNGWMDEGMNGWRDGWMDEGMKGWRDDKRDLTRHGPKARRILTKKIRSKIPRRSVVLMSQIDRKSYELWSKEFLSKNDFSSQNLILKFKNKISKSKPFRFFIKHSFFDSNIDLFLSKIFHSYGKTISFNKS